LYRGGCTRLCIAGEEKKFVVKNVTFNAVACAARWRKSELEKGEAEKSCELTER
jgi:hypothetical protein